MSLLLLLAYRSYARPSNNSLNFSWASTESICSGVVFRVTTSTMVSKTVRMEKHSYEGKTHYSIQLLRCKVNSYE